MIDSEIEHPYEHSWKAVTADGETVCICGKRYSDPIHYDLELTYFAQLQNRYVAV